MNKIATVAVAWLALCPSLHPQDAKQAQQNACYVACMLERPNPDLQRQEVIALERETARAIQLGDATFFRRVFSDDFAGVLSRGATVDKAAFISAVQTSDVKYDSFTASDISVRLYRDLAVATCTWSIRAILKGQRVSSQMRVVHVYLYSGAGFHVVTAQNTLLPPYSEQPL